jgi:hypothetical protein
MFNIFLITFGLTLISPPQVVALECMQDGYYKDTRNRCVSNHSKELRIPSNSRIGNQQQKSVMEMLEKKTTPYRWERGRHGGTNMSEVTYEDAIKCLSDHELFNPIFE